MLVDTLLRPVSESAPCGDDLSFSLEFDAILEKRREDDPTLDQGDWVRPLKLADWPGVVAQCTQLLTERTKDLRVVAWLADAEARLRGFAGLADGLELCERLCAAHWEALHPRSDDGDFDQRAGSLAWLLAQVGTLSRLATLFGPNRVDDVQRSLDGLRRLQHCVDARMGADAPGFGAARKALEEALHHAERAARESPADAGVEAPLGTAATGMASTTRAAPAGALQSRAEALTQLRAVADFFRRTEPHSPVAYLADKAAAWGEMPLHAWLRAVLKDPNALAHVEEVLGVQPSAN